MAASVGDHYAVSGGTGGTGGEGTTFSTPFVSAPSSPARDPSFRAAAAAGFYSAPASPAHGAGDEYGSDFDFSSQFPSPAAAAAMSSADELFHNGQIRTVRLSTFLLRAQAALPPLANDVPGPRRPEVSPAVADERGRFRSRSARRRSRSHSPFSQPRCLSPSANSGDPSEASRTSSSSSTASFASSSSSSHHSRWRFLKDLLRGSSSDGGGKHHHHPPTHSPPPRAACKKSLPPAETRERGRRRSSTHARLYEARRAEAEEMRRRTFLPYRQGLLLGCLGLSSWSYGAMHDLAFAAKSRA